MLLAPLLILRLVVEADLRLDAQLSQGRGEIQREAFFLAILDHDLETNLRAVFRQGAVDQIIAGACEQGLRLAGDIRSRPDPS